MVLGAEAEIVEAKVQVRLQKKIIRISNDFIELKISGLVIFSFCVGSCVAFVRFHYFGCKSLD